MAHTFSMNKLEASDFLMGKFNPEDIEEMNRLSRTPNLYKHIHTSVAPALYGYEDIKKAVACQLFGGTRYVDKNNNLDCYLPCDASFEI